MKGDNDNNEDDGRKVTSFEDFLRRRFPEMKKDGDHTPTPPIAPHDVPTSPHAVLAAARLELAAYFNYIADPNNPGLKILKGNPHYQMLEAVWNDDLGKFMSTMALAKLPHLKRRWYWHFPADMTDVSFLAPAHLARTHLMAVAINKHGGDFKAQDSEGRTPLYYISRHGRDPWLIPYIVSSLKVDPYDGGRCTNDYNMQSEKGDPYEEPFMRAIRYANGAIVEGFLQIAPHDFDINRPRNNWGQSPLILAVQEANEAAMKYPGHGPGRQELLRRLWIVREMAGEPAVDINHKDAAGNTAQDYALEPAVRGAFDAGLLARQKNGRLPRALRNGPPAP